jgi:hypothetical protein
MNLADELRKLTELHQAGHLTDQEFADAKRRLIAEAGAEPPEGSNTGTGDAWQYTEENGWVRTGGGTTPPPLPKEEQTVPGRVAPPLPRQAAQRKKKDTLKAFLFVFGVVVVLWIISKAVNPSGSQSSSSGSPSNAPVATATTSQNAVANSAVSPSNAPVATATRAQPAAAPAATAPERPITWREIDSIYNVSSKKTDLQKENLWKGYKGKRVTWSGEVVGVSEGWFGGLSLQVKMNRNTFTFDLLINLKKTEKAKASQLHQGDKVRFTGILSTWGSLLPISLDDGEIIQ